MDELPPDTSAQLEQVNARFDELQRAGRIGYWEWDVGNSSLYWSDVLYELFDQPTCARPTVEQFIELVHPQDRELVMNKFDATMNGTIDSFVIEFRMGSPPAEQRHIEARGRVRRSADGTIVRLAGTARDFSEYRRMEQQFHQSQKMEAVGGLAAGVAHDFNNLLTVIGGYAELIASANPADTAVANPAVEIIRTAARARVLTQRLLALARRQVLDLENVNLADYLRAFEDVLRRVLRDDIVISCGVAQLADTSAFGARLDTSQLDQILLNVATNAQDAMPHGGEFEIALQRVDAAATGWHNLPRGEWLQLTLRDTGVGMDEAIVQRIFEPFFSTKNSTQGTGLGLAMVYGVVEQHGGYVSASSQPDVGTTFTILLPAVDLPADEDPDDDLIVVQAALQDRSILVVEDEAGVRKVVEAMLRPTGAELTIVDAPDVALATARDHNFDVLLTDVIMPQMKGTELYKKIRQLQPGLRVVFMSGYAQELFAEINSGREREEFLQKPFDSNQLATAIRQALEA